LPEMSLLSIRMDLPEIRYSLTCIAVHHCNQSYQTQQGIKYSYDRSKLFLPKLGWVKCIFSKKIEGKIKTCTISRNPAGEYNVSIIVESEGSYPKLPEIKEETAVGIDVGVKNLAILSAKTFV
jgi:putative transposase